MMPLSMAILRAVVNALVAWKLLFPVKCRLLVEAPRLPSFATCSTPPRIRVSPM
ncbi:hypothetical protein DP49_5698 [Burkholderia pseudomallei]|nr:hypothetical protein DP49_5698 [Burkholderia pseudomallei]